MRKPYSSRRGVALILVLAFLVLITGIVLAFFAKVTTEVGSAKSYANGANAKQLADTAVQTVIGQIRQASSKGSTATWASQPGMIRTYDTSAGPVDYYKLYSSDNMVVTKTQIPSFDVGQDIDATWDTETALFTDLNSPVMDSTTGENVFPIIDPRAAGVVSGSSSLVDGFSYTDKPKVNGATVDLSKKVKLPSSSADAAARLPMPVKWMYVLRDGTLTVADATSTATATFLKEPVYKQPGTANPIVGRVAFWADDETCKLNVNTASEGSFWDQPTFCASQEVAFSQYQPATREFSRYLGHPATTSLSPVLWSFFSLSNPAATLSALPGTANYDTSMDASPQLASYGATFFQSIMNLSPRNIWGGSQAGTRQTLAGANAITTTSLDGDRLYASLDEVLFAPSASGSPTRSTSDPKLSAKDLAKLRFFLTANSRAPEVNPFGQPKVTMWPVPDPNPANKNPVNANMAQSPEDKLIAFCSTLNGNPYYFTRFDPTSPTADFTARNQAVYNYVRALLDNKVPGFGDSFVSANKWNGIQRDQILTLVYDYIRSCINLVDTSAGSSTAPNYTYSYTTPPNTAKGPVWGSGQVVPISIKNPGGNVTKGIGRFPTLRGATLQFIARAANQPPLEVYTSGSFKQCPVLYDSAGNQLWDGNGTGMNQTALTAVLSGTAYSKVNYMHPWTCPPAQANGLVQQLTSNGTPVLAVDPNKLKINPNDTTGIYPIFDLSGTNTASTAPTRTYPSLDFVSGVNGLYAAAAGSGATITYNAAKYNYFVAANVVKLAPGYGSTAPPSAPQTHAGLPFLTAQRATGNSSSGNMEGAFDIANPNYKDVVLAPYQTRTEAILILDPVNVASGLVGMLPDCQFRVQHLDSFMAGGAPLGFSGDATEAIQNNTNGAGGNHPQPWMPNFLYEYGWQLSIAQRYTNKAPNKYQQMPFFSAPTLLKDTGDKGQTFSFTGSTLQVDIQTPTPTFSGGASVQTISLKFPDATFPTPKLVPWWNAAQFMDYPPTNVAAGSPGSNSGSDLVPMAMLTFDRTDPNAGNSSRLTQNSANFRTEYMFISSEMNCSANGSDPSFAGQKAGLNRITCDTFRAVECQYGDLRMVAALKNVPDTFFVPNPYYTYSTPYTVANMKTYMRAAHSMRIADAVSLGAQMATLIDTNSVKYPSGANSVGGVAGIKTPSGNPITNVADIELPRGIGAYTGTGGHTEFPYGAPTADFADTKFQTVWKNGGDFDNGIGMFSDGPFINKADEGNGQTGGTFITNPYYSIDFHPAGNTLFSPNRQVPSSVMLGSLPVGFNQIGTISNPSPNVLQDSWRTLLFCPNPNATDVPTRDTRVATNGMTEAGQAFSGKTVPDHVLLDFFHMPVVEPYPISEPFSTAGKVNMNYQIAPFSYITRSTAMRGVLKSVMLTAVDDQFIGHYKLRGNGDNSATFGDNKNPTAYAAGGYNQFGADTNNQYFRYPVHVGETLKQFDQRFSNADLFRSPSEICSLWLYPAKQPSVANPAATATSTVQWDAVNLNIKNWWYAGAGTTRKSLTGDNQRERPYASIYPRLTTRSNTYTVHFRVQTLKKSPGTDPVQWVEGKDQIVADNRGSSVIERYVDPSDTKLPDFTSSADTNNNGTPDNQETLDSYYKFRVVSAKRFSPQ